jgi:tRNA(Ile)-lysidine synthase
MSEDLFSTFKKTLARYQMIAPGDKVLVAFSGGPDSMALVHLHLELRRKMPIEIILAHFNHKLRAAADLDERFVREVARGFRLPVIVKRRNVKAYARTRGLNLEEAGRKLRYEFLREAAARCGATKIATGHTQSDQAETVLMRILRGSGLRGLGGIHPVVEAKIIRPLIEIRRKEIEAYCRSRKLPFRADETNRDRRFLRNKIRLGLIPNLERNYEGRIVARLGRLAEVLREEENYLEGLAQKKCANLIVRRDDRIMLDVRSLAKRPKALARRFVRAFIRDIKGDLRAVSFEDVERLLELGDGREIILPKKLHLRREGDFLFLREKPEPKIGYEYAWDGKSRLIIREIGLSFSGRKIKNAKMNVSLSFDDETICLCDAQRLRFPLVVRSRQNGDRYQPLGAPGRKKLKEIFRAKSIPSAEREQHPVFCSGGDIVWVLGLPVAEKFKITPTTKSIFQIRKV